jgi:S-adenosylmethionine:tRNA ribosyltransferase-isomerase
MVIEHATFRDLDRYLSAGDLLVLNDTRVLPARLIGRKESGGRIELLLIEPEQRAEESDGSQANAEGAAGAGEVIRAQPLREFEAREPASGTHVWLCLAGFSRAPAPGSRLDFGPALEVRYLGRARGEMHRVQLLPASGRDLHEALLREGRMPMPPYIERNGDERTALEDAERYQTIFAEKEGAIAAPTAGLHFTHELLRRLSERGIASARITLHVGPATFLPVRTEEIEDHPMPAERYEVPRETARAIAQAHDRGGRIVAVGTTVVRALESAATGRGGVLAARGRTELFISPGYRFRVADGLVTNFHLPGSTLLMLVAAFAGRETVLAAYGQAVAAGYRFYSYGDAMLIL